MGNNWQYDPSPIAGLYRLSRDSKFPMEAIDALDELLSMQDKLFEDRAKVLYESCDALMLMREYRKDNDRRENQTNNLFAEIDQDRKKRDQWCDFSIDRLEALWHDRDELDPADRAILRAELRKRKGISKI